MRRYLAEDFSNPGIQALIEEQGWRGVSELDCVRGTYGHVRAEILFGYNVGDNIPASRVLADGFGSDTKATLFMAPAFAHRHLGRHLMSRNVMRMRRSRREATCLRVG